MNTKNGILQSEKMVDAKFPNQFREPKDSFDAINDN